MRDIWLEDKNGNKCSVAYFGSKEKAQEALDSLKDCTDCINCSGCSDCSRKEGVKGHDSEFKVPKVPIIPNIHKKVYAAVTAPNHGLDMGDWHTCETTHCRGGWVVTLAGEAGKELEKFHGSLLAAQLIYNASDTKRKFNPCRFFDSNEEALADMKRLAEAQ